MGTILKEYGKIITTVVAVLLLIAVVTGALAMDGLIFTESNSSGDLPDEGNGSHDPVGENYVGTVSADNTITLLGVETSGTYTLRYANADGSLSNYADICSLVVTDPATAVSYNGLIAENCAPVEATTIAVYNESNEKVGNIALGSLAIDLGEKLYSFGAVADTHVSSGVTEHNYDYARALTYFSTVENVSFVINGGDLTDTGTVADFEKLKNLGDTYSSVPVYLAGGNHDTLADVYTPTEFETYAGNPLYFSFTHGNDVFILLGMALDREQTGRLFTDEQYQWLYETLEANRDKRCFVFEHVFFDFSSGDPNNLLSYGNLLSDAEESLLTGLLSHYSNVIVMHGHSHFEFAMQQRNDEANYDNKLGIHSVHMPSLAAPRNVNADGTIKYIDSGSEGYVIDVYANGIVLRGRDFIKQKFLPIAQYRLDTTIKPVDANSFVDGSGVIDTSK